MAASPWQCSHSCITSSVEIFGKTSNRPGDSAPHSPDLTPFDFGLFPKLKSPLKGKRFQTRRDSGKYHRAADGNWENCVMSQDAYLEGDRGIIVLWTMYLVTCIFFRKCLFFIVHGWILSGQISLIFCWSVVGWGWAVDIYVYVNRHVYTCIHTYSIRQMKYNTIK